MCLTMKGERRYLWRAVAQDGHVLDIVVQRRRDKQAAKKFFRKLLKGLSYVPRVLITDKVEESAYPPRSGWLAGLGRLKDGSLRLKSSPLIFRLLFPDILPHRLQLVAYGRHRRAPRPEVGTREVLQLSPKLSGNRHRPLALQKADKRGHRMLGRDLNTPMNMVR